MLPTSLLVRHTLRSLAAVKFRLFVIGLICASTFGVTLGAYSAIKSLSRTVNAIQIESNMADLDLVIATEDVKNIPDFSRISGVEHVARRMVLTGQAILGEGPVVSSVLIATAPENHGQLNRLVPLQGHLPDRSDSEGIALERNCAKFYGKSIGDRIILKVGKAEYRFIVRSIVQSPEFLITPLNPSLYVPSNGSICILFGSDQVVHRQFGYETANNLLFWVDKSRLETVRNEIVKLAHTRLSVDYSLTRSEHFNQKFLELQVGTFEIFLPVVVLIFSITSVFVVFFLTYQWIKSERPLIAMMMTLGYRRDQLVEAYLIPAGAIIIFAIVVGIPIAWLDMWAFSTNFAQSLGMPEPRLKLDPGYAIVSVVITVFTVAIGMYMPARALLRVQPIDALRDQPSNGQSESRAFELASVLPGPFTIRYAIRNLLRSWRVTLVAASSIAACLAVTISFYVVHSSIIGTAQISLSGDSWQAVVELDAPLWDDEMERLRDAVPGSTWSPFTKGVGQIVGNRRSDNVFITGIEPRDRARHPVILEGEMLSHSDDTGVLLERRLARNHGLHPGNNVRLRVKGTEHRFRVVGIHSTAVPGEVIMNRQRASKTLAMQDQFTGAFLTSPLPATSTVRETLMNVEGVVRLTHRQEIGNAILSLSDHIWVIIHLASILSIAVALMFLLNSTSFSVIDRQGEYGMLRILGYPNRVIVSVVMIEVVLTGLFGGLLALPLGWLLGAALNERLTSILYKVFTLPSFADFYTVLVPAMVFMPLAALHGLRFVFKVNPIEVLKNRNFG